MTLFVLFLTVVYFSIIEYQRKSNQSFLSMIDVLTNVQEVYDRGIENLPTATLENLSKISAVAAWDVAKLRSDEWSRIVQNGDKSDKETPQSTEDLEQALEVVWEGARIFEGLSLRMVPGKKCNLLFMQGSSEQSVMLIDFFGGPQSAKVPLSKMHLVNFSDHCRFGDFFRLSLLIFDTSDELGVRLIGLPTIYYPFFEQDLWDDPVLEYLEKLYERLEPELRKGILEPLRPQSLKLEDSHFSHLPEKLRSYIYKFGDYTIISEDFVNSLILGRAQQLTRQIYAPEERESALKDVFKVGIKEAKLFGFQLDHLTLIRVAPLITIILTYLMYRRLRVIRFETEETTEPWVFLRIDNRFDMVIAYVLMVTPAIFVVSIFMLFCDTQDLHIEVFGRVISFRGLITLSFPRSLFMPPEIDPYAMIVSILVAVNLYWLTLTTKYVWDIIQHDRYIRRTYP